MTFHPITLRGWFLGIFVSFVCACGQPIRADDQAARIDPLATRFLETSKTPGVVIGILHHGETQTFGYGRAIDGSDKPPDGDTLFEIGSVTKVFTAIALAIAVDRKAMTLDDPVQTLLPDEMRVPTKGGIAITLRHLSTHMSGLPRIPPHTVVMSLVSANPYATFDAKLLGQFLNNHTLRRNPGEAFEYSNLAVGLLGFGLARQVGTTYEKMILEEIAKPLHMPSTKIVLDANEKARFASPHSEGGGNASYWDLDAIAGAGALRSSANDMLTFLQANLNPGSTPLAAALSATHLPQHETGSPGTKGGLGWIITESPRGTLIWHNGGTGGFSSFVGFDPKRHLGIVVLGNSAARVDPLAQDVWNVLIESASPSKIAK